MFQRTIWLTLIIVHFISHNSMAAEKYKSRPVITSISPASGPPSTQVTIKGAHFSSEYKVYFNGQELKPVKMDAKQVIVKIPPKAVQGRFTLKGIIHEVISPQVFWVINAGVAPLVSGISPRSGSPGKMITITGKHFSKNMYENSVMIGTSPLQVRSANSTKIEAIVPVGAKTGHVSVKVHNAGQATSRQTFKVLAQLKISSFKPQAGPPGTRVTLQGSGFSLNKEGNQVTLGGKKCRVLKAGAEQLLIEVPKKEAATGRFSVTVKKLGTAGHQGTFSVAYSPQLISFEPLSGKVGQEVMISGAHFGKNPKDIQVQLASRPCQVVSVIDSQIRVRIPNGAITGLFEVILEKKGSAASKKSFEVLAPLTVTQMQPLLGLPGSEIRLLGTGFKSLPKDHTLMMGNKKIKIERIEKGALVYKIPKNAADGQVSLRLEVKDRGSIAVPMPLTVIHKPEISGFTPKKGPPGTPVIITGKYFGTKANHIRVLLGSHVLPATAVTQSSIHVVIPRGATSSQFQIQTVRRGNAKSKSKFETFVPVRVTNFLPSVGYNGKIISLFGSGFDPVTSRNKVTLGGRRLTVSKASATMLTVKLPKMIKDGKFRVEVPGRGFSETSRQFRVVEKLEITGFSPSRGLPGAYVTVKGKGFTNKGLRGYLGQTPMGLRVDSASQATIAVPPNAPEGNLVFTAPGAGRAKSRGVFKVLTPLTLSGFRPTAGPAGTRVAIYGSGFNLKSNKTRVVYGNQTLRLEPGSNEQMLIVQVPKDALNHPFRVWVAERGEVESENIFSVYRPAGIPPSAPAVATRVPAPAPMPAPPQPASGSKPVPPPVATPKTAQGAVPMDKMLGINASESDVKISSLDPQNGAVGDVITVNGSGFGEEIEKVKAWVGDIPATVIGVVPDMMMVEVPGEVKRGKVRIKIAGKLTVSSKDLFTVDP